MHLLADRVGPMNGGQRIGLEGRRWIVGGTVVVGAALIAITLRVPRGSSLFYLSVCANAIVWTAASMLCGPIELVADRATTRRDVALGVVIAAGSYLVFVIGAVVGRHISVLAGPIDSILRKADAGSLWLVLVVALVNGVAEELFFRGALIDVLRTRHVVLVSVAVYVGVTAVAGNTALTLAAAVMGTVFAVERVVTRGLLAPITTHLVWSTLMILALPR